jgi:hypothetical protein
VRLADFTPEQVRELVGKGDWPADQAAALAARIYYWTDGQPYLTQMLCTYLAQQDTSVTPDDVDTGVERLYREDENHLPPLFGRLYADTRLEDYVRRVVDGERIKFVPRENRRQGQLELLGIIKPDEEDCCRIRNRIYEQALQVGIEPEQPPKPHSPPDKCYYDAFISYSHHDKTWVHGTLLLRLEAADLRVCIDFRNFELGAPSLTEMERAVLQSRKTLLVLTPDYLASEWTEFENILASTLDPAARRRRVIPLLLKPCKPPLRIRVLTHVDFTGSENELQFQRLVAAIRTEPKSDQPVFVLEPVSPKVSDLCLLVADPSGKQLVSHLEFSIPPRDPSRKLAYAVAFRLYLDNQGQTMARYVIIDMSVTSDTDFFLAYRYESEPLLIEESPRRWQTTVSNAYGQCYFEGGADFVCHGKAQQCLGLMKMLVPYGQSDTTVTFRYRILADGFDSRGSFTIALEPEGKG